MVELKLGEYTLEMIYNALIDRGRLSGYPVTDTLALALGYYGGVEQVLRDKSRALKKPFADLLWEWIAERLEDLA